MVIYHEMHGPGKNAVVCSQQHVSVHGENRPIPQNSNSRIVNKEIESCITYIGQETTQPHDLGQRWKLPLQRDTFALELANFCKQLQLIFGRFDSEAGKALKNSFVLVSRGWEDGEMQWFADFLVISRIYGTKKESKEECVLF